VLVLTRKRLQTIVIDPTKCPRDELGRILVTVVDVKGDTCRIGIEAPRNVIVHRVEVQDAIDRENAA
jgi:carbon storage regulator